MYIYILYLYLWAECPPSLVEDSCTTRAQTGTFFNLISWLLWGMPRDLKQANYCNNLKIKSVVWSLFVSSWRLLTCFACLSSSDTFLLNLADDSIIYSFSKASKKDCKFVQQIFSPLLKDPHMEKHWTSNIKLEKNTFISSCKHKVLPANGSVWIL